MRNKYRELFGEEPRSKHRQSLVRQLAWRLEALAEGGLSERARLHALEIANDLDIRVLPPRALKHRDEGRFDRRIPPVGTLLCRDYRGITITVKVLVKSRIPVAGILDHAVYFRRECKRPGYSISRPNEPEKRSRWLTNIVQGLGRQLS